MTEHDELAEIREAKREELLSGERGDDEAGTPDNPVQVETESHFDELLSEHDVVLVDFYADWCGPCQMLGQYIGDVAAESEAAVLKVDVDQQQGLAGRFGVQGIPNMLVFRDGEPVQRLVGLKDKAEILAAIRAA
ncbi:thioredoxin family protein [Haloarchaeobius sp. DFWS5]|uniref:thioredoxin family protein n=1 Tax=Haloarchaeobius sp. DFWS5 TaxID=3446114 RepID=UPI003EC0D8FE